MKTFSILTALRTIQKTKISFLIILSILVSKNGLSQCTLVPPGNPFNIVDEGQPCYGFTPFEAFYYNAGCVSINDIWTLHTTPIQIGQTIHGYSEANGYTRDLDMYSFTLTDTTVVTLYGTAQFSFYIAFRNPCGSPQGQTYIDWRLVPACSTDSVTHTFLPGTHLVEIEPALPVVGPSMPCKDYYIALKGTTTWYLDEDEDGYYSDTQQSGDSPGTGWSEDPEEGGGDCEDSFSALGPLMYPDAPGGILILSGTCNNGGTITVDVVSYDCTSTIEQVTFLAIDQNGLLLPPPGPNNAGDNIYSGEYTNVPPGTYTVSVCNNNGECFNESVTVSACNQTWYRDVDGDNRYGESVQSATIPAGTGWSNNPENGGNDCDDTDATVFPGNPEVCDNEDNDCNTSVDDGISVTTGGATIVTYTNPGGNGCRNGTVTVSYDNNNCWTTLECSVQPPGGGVAEAQITAMYPNNQITIPNVPAGTWIVNLRDPVTLQQVQTQTFTLSDPVVIEDFNYSFAVPSSTLVQGCTQPITVTLTTVNCYKNWSLYLDYCTVSPLPVPQVVCDEGQAAMLNIPYPVIGDPGESIVLELPALNSNLQDFRVGGVVELKDGSINVLPEQYIPHVTQVQPGGGTVTHSILTLPVTDCSADGSVKFILQNAVQTCVIEDAIWQIDIYNAQGALVTGVQGSFPLNGTPQPITVTGLKAGHYSYSTGHANNNGALQQFNLLSLSGNLGPTITIVPTGGIVGQTATTVDWCSNGNDVLLSAYPSTGYTYRWYKNGGFLRDAFQNIVDDPTVPISNEIDAGVYKVEITGANGCTAESQTLTMNNVALLKPSSISGRTHGVCKNTPVTYSVTPGSGTGVVYNWILTPADQIKDLTGQGSPQITFKFKNSFNSGVLRVYKSSNPANICGPSEEETLNIYAGLSQPQFPAGGGWNQNFVCPNSLHNYICTEVPGATSYQWSIPNTATIIDPDGPSGIEWGQGNRQIRVQFGNNVGNIRVRAKNECVESPLQTLQVSRYGSCRVGEESVNAYQEFGIYPNPVGNTLSISTEYHGRAHVRIANALGQQVLSIEMQFDGENVSTDVSMLPAGIYLISLIGYSNTYTARFIKE